MATENLVLNLDNVEESKGFEALPKGKYDAVVDDCEFGESSKGSPMITWKFKLDSEEYGKRTLYYYTVLDQSFGLSNLKKTLIALGIDIDFAAFNPAEFCDAGEAIGIPVTLNVGIQKYEGEKRNTVKEVLPAEEAGSFMDM